MDIKDVKVFIDDWNAFDDNEKIQVLLEEHCNCSDVVVSSIAGDFVEYEVTPPKGTTLSLFFQNLKDIAEPVKISLQEGERIKIEVFVPDMKFEARSNK